MAETAENTTFKPVAMKKWQLAASYGVSCKTLAAWMELLPDQVVAEIGEYKGKCYTPAQIALIVHHLGPI